MANPSPLTPVDRPRRLTPNTHPSYNHTVIPIFTSTGGSWISLLE
jgi:hypothetical protein